MKPARILLTTALSLSLAGAALANTYGSVEPIANPAVIDTAPLRDQSLDVREAFAERLLQCGIVDQVIAALSSTAAPSHHQRPEHTLRGRRREASRERPTPRTSTR